jgi:hypothetical protein
MNSQLVQTATETRSLVDGIKDLAVRGLPVMLDPQTNLFCYRLKKTARGLIREGLSRRYTMICLLGIYQAKRAGMQLPIDCSGILQSLVSNADWIRDLGDLGLLLWVYSLYYPERLAQVAIDLDVTNALARYSGGKERRTVDLAWFLSGLTHWGLASEQSIPDLRRLATKTYHLLINNQSRSGIFGHLARHGGLAGAARSRIGCFADQVYPIYALSRFAHAFQLEEAAKQALACAEAICDAQGPLGQWWWHYDSVSGRVVGKYPVFSVHQDGMAPMALFALSEVVGRDLSFWIEKGLLWICGHNELGFDFRDTTAETIWRSAYREDYKRYWTTAIALLTQGGDGGNYGDLKIRFECRPYHFGWLLYALSNAYDPKFR